jgi:hypothetical protein
MSDLPTWAATLKSALGLPPDLEVDVTAILDVARDAAHAVDRPAAPVSTYLLGYAVAAGMPVDEAVAAITRACATWPVTD